MNKKIDIAIVGATGEVGKTFIEILQQRKFPVGRLHLLASERSEGKTIQFNGRSHRVTNLKNFDFSEAQIAFFSAGSKIAGEYAPKAAAAGCVVIDNSSKFRNEPDVPLIVPEVNPDALNDYRKRHIIANPNCSTIQMVVALKPLHDYAGISRIQVCTYQSVSGAGFKGIQELATQTAQLLNGQEIIAEVFPRQIAFNVLPQIGEFDKNGYSQEEMKMVHETRKILGNNRIQVNPTTVRVPVFYGHSEAVNIETKKELPAKKATALLKAAPGVALLPKNTYPTALNAAGQDAVFVGRIRNDLSKKNSLNLWIISDNIRKGAALNGVQIAELLIKQRKK